MPSKRKALVFALFSFLLVGCEPSDRRPGLWLSGEQADEAPTDWQFTNDLKEIYVQVDTPYFLPHSVTIWCAEVDGELYIGARNPDEKKWPGWVEKSPQVILKIDDNLYSAKIARVTEVALVAKVKAAYAQKYLLETEPGATPPPMRYWKVDPSVDPAAREPS
ncbi:MAG: hypothetical protein ACU84Q_13300 [Gammaproteobacteria bacterium]